MDWNDVRYFLAVARAGSLAGAARTLKVEHSTVGRRLDAFERALGARLFLRGPTGFQLTTTGTQLLPLAENVERAIEALSRQGSGDDGRLEGTVRLTTSEVMSGFLMKSMLALRAQHPALRIEILSGNRTFDLARGEADLAVRIAPTSQPDLIVRTLAVCAWALYAATTYAERCGLLSDATALAGHDIIGFDESLANVPGALWLSQHAVGASFPLRANSIIAALNAAHAGVGIAAIPCFLADREPTLRRLSPTIIGTRDVFLVVHPDALRVARVRAVMDFLIELFKNERDFLAGAEPAAP